LIPATVDLTIAGRETWDALVIGAGPAGALAARQLAGAGRRALLVDSKAFPRPKVCGACLNERGLAILRSVGLGDLPQWLGGVAINRFDVRSHGRGVKLPLPDGFAVSRIRFDAALVEQAIAAGAAFLPETTATVGEIEHFGGQECRSVMIRQRDSSAAQVRARVVLAADGLGHASLREHAEFSSQVARGARIGLGGQVSDYPAAYVQGTVSMAVGRHGYVGLVRVEDELLNIAGALDLAFVKSSGSVPAALGMVIAAAGFPPIDALSKADWHGTVALTRRAAQTAGRRLLVLGDAAGYVEPFTGEGMTWAIAAARAAPQFVARGLSSWDGELERDWKRTLQRLVLRRQNWCRMLALASRHPLAVKILMGVVSRFPSLAQPIIRSVNSELHSAAPRG
jgi:flavin-dependent dehydrogenase